MIKHIVTHSGTFHADDVIGVSVLNTLFPKAKIVRTRDVELLKKAITDSRIATVDVGGSADVNNNNFDHHQREGGGMRDNCCPYAAAGLVWSRYGSQYVREIFKELGSTDVSRIIEAVDQRILQFVDAVDNGALEPSPNILKKVATPAPIHGCSISTLVHLQNPTSDNLKDYDSEFINTVGFVGELFYKAVQHLGHGVLQEGSVRAEVLDQIKRTPDPVMVLKTYADSWQRVVCEEDTYGFLKYVVFKSPEGTWMVQQVPVTTSSTTGRKPLPEAWAGLKNEEMAAVTGVPDSVFCHRGRFLCGAASLEGALALARLAVAA